MSAVSGTIVRIVPLIPRALVWRVARRYVAGSSLADAVATVRELNALGAMATIDVLGEEVREREKASAAVAEYLRVYEAIDREGLDANVSVKPTMLGLAIDEGFCSDNLATLARAASERGNFLRIDMEDRTTTDATLRMYRQLQGRYGRVGAVLQAYMRRTLRDIDGLPAAGANVRLCKGIYVEPRAVAWKGYDTVRANFVAALDKLLDRGVYAAIATHDEYLVCRACAAVDRHRLGRDQYELQMLLGVDQALRDLLLAEGHRLRVYVP
ncbi:MAG TPA: proline dehydrogenase family protein, partial [Thermoanaerobaculia bacterium]|nr:proline dehydrogenase family protein [Thermoanaerobaculia bacterium]